MIARIQRIDHDMVYLRFSDGQELAWPRTEFEGPNEVGAHVTVQTSADVRREERFAKVFLNEIFSDI